MSYRIPPETGDPSVVVQDFQKIGINIQCCRYWWMSKWKHKRLSYPFWRLYYNFNEGAWVFYGRKIELTPQSVLVIPPFTPFSTDLEHDSASREYGLEGGWIKSEEIERSSLEAGHVLHLFIHFNLGYQYDSVQPGVFVIYVEPEDEVKLKRITNKLKTGSTAFSMSDTLLLHQVITSFLDRLPGEIWDVKIPDQRVQLAIQYMNQRFDHNLTNEEMASRVGMAVNSFGRLFKEQTGMSPQQYLTRIRIENACNQLYHTQSNIDVIAEESGFSDRYYFSRVFKREMKISPVKYRKQFQLS